MLFDAAGVPAEFVVTQSEQELESRAQEAIAQNRQVLLIMGGDGTFQALVNAAVGADVVLGVLPVGGGNDFSTAIGMPDDQVAAAKALLQGEKRAVDLV